MGKELAINYSSNDHEVDKYVKGVYVCDMGVPYACIHRLYEFKVLSNKV